MRLEKIPQIIWTNFLNQQSPSNVKRGHSPINPFDPQL